MVKSGKQHKLFTFFLLSENDLPEIFAENWRIEWVFDESQVEVAKSGKTKTVAPIGAGRVTGASLDGRRKSEGATSNLCRDDS